eukprot:5542284-Amphidinium_carterae.1
MDESHPKAKPSSHHLGPKAWVTNYNFVMASGKIKTLKVVSKLARRTSWGPTSWLQANSNGATSQGEQQQTSCPPAHISAQPIHVPLST